METLPSARTLEAVRYALVTSIIAIVGSTLVVHFMRQHMIISTPAWTLGFASEGVLSGNFGLWWQSLALLGGDFYSRSITLLPIVYFSAAALTVAAVVLIAWVAQFELRNVGSTNTITSGDGPSTASVRPARDAFVVAWGMSALLVSVAFVVTSAPEGLTTSRYLVGVLMAAAALVPLVARRREMMAVVVVAVSIYCISGLISIARGEASRSGGVTQSDVDTFASLARLDNVDHGYAGYWDAAPITWKSGFHVLTYPVEECRAGICRAYLGNDSAWYEPHGEERTFLITNTSRPGMESVPASLGPPAYAIRVGASYTFNVYDYDIASRIRPNGR